MKSRNLFLILLLIAIFSLAICSVSALKIEHEDCNSLSAYYYGLKKVSAKGYGYHGGELHKNVIKPNSKYEAPYCYNGPNKKCKYYGRTDIGFWMVTGTVAEMKKVKYGSIKINGEYYNKKVKLYYDERFDGTGKAPNYHPTNDVKGNLKGKMITLGVHDKNGKLLTSNSFKIKKITTYYYNGE